MKNTDLMQALGDLPEADIARELQTMREGTDTAGAGLSEMPEAETAAAEKHSPLRLIVTLAATAASLMIAVGIGVMMHRAGRDPGQTVSSAETLQTERVSSQTDGRPESTSDAKSTDTTKQTGAQTSDTVPTVSEPLHSTGPGVQTDTQKAEGSAGNKTSETQSGKQSLTTESRAGETQTTPETTKSTAPRETVKPVLLKAKGSRPVTWIDITSSKPNGYPAVRVDMLPDMVFEYRDGEGIYLLTEDGGEQGICAGMGVRVFRAYFCDLNFDGYPELCAQSSWGSGMIDERITVYDCRARQTYTLSDRCKTDYILHEYNDALFATMVPYNDGNPVLPSGKEYPKGQLVFEDGTLTVAEEQKTPAAGKTVAGTAALNVTRWEGKQYVGAPLELGGLGIQIEAAVSRDYSQIEVTGLLAHLAQKNRHCWHLDTSAVDFTKPGTYTVWFETYGDEILTQDLHYRIPNDFGYSVETNTYTVRLKPSRQALQITLEEPSRELHFRDESGKTDPQVYEFNRIWTGCLTLENVWGQDVTYTVSDPSVLRVDRTRQVYHGRETIFELIGLKDGEVTLTAKAADGRTKNIKVRVKYVNDNLADE